MTKDQIDALMEWVKEWAAYAASPLNENARYAVEAEKRLRAAFEPIPQRSTYTNLRYRNDNSLPLCDACGHPYSEHDPIGFYCPTKKSGEQP